MGDILFQTENIFPLFDPLNHYFGEILYCIPEGHINTIPEKYLFKTVTYEKLYYGPWNKKHEVSACFPNICIEKAFRYSKDKNLNVKGYLLKGDDTFILHKNRILNSNFDKVWIRKDYWIYDTRTRCHNEGGEKEPTNCKKSYWDTWWNEDQIIGTLLSLRYYKISKDSIHNNCSKFLKEKLGTDSRIYYQPTITDFLYVPASLVETYIKLMKPFIYNHVIFETALPNVLECLVYVTNSSILPVVGINSRDQNIRNKLIKDPHQMIVQSFLDETTFLHPIKLSSMILNYAKSKHNGTHISPLQQSFCNDILPYIISSL